MKTHLLAVLALELACTPTSVYAIDLGGLIKKAVNPLTPITPADVPIPKGVPAPPAPPSPVDLVKTAPAAAVDAMQTEIKHTTQLIEAIKSGKVDETVANELQAGVNRALNKSVTTMLQPTLAALTFAPMFKDLMMVAPEIKAINPYGYSGTTIHFVNGMSTSQEDAITEAICLSHQLKRPVGLLYNATNGWEGDLVEAAYDRTWPFLQLIPGNPQINSTTKQVAHLLYNSDKPISIVSHSQGCIIVRNALLIANSYSQGAAKDRCIWVATGMPLRDEEVYPKPMRYRVISNHDDAVYQTIGLKLDPKEFSRQNADVAHDFIQSYVLQIGIADLQ